jgi:hypothetical protein
MAEFTSARVYYGHPLLSHIGSIEGETSSDNGAFLCFRLSETAQLPLILYELCELCGQASRQSSSCPHTSLALNIPIPSSLAAENSYSCC